MRPSARLSLFWLRKSLICAKYRYLIWSYNIPYNSTIRHAKPPFHSSNIYLIDLSNTLSLIVLKRQSPPECWEDAASPIRVLKCLFRENPVETIQGERTEKMRQKRTTWKQIALFCSLTENGIEGDWSSPLTSLPRVHFFPKVPKIPSISSVSLPRQARPRHWLPYRYYLIVNRCFLPARECFGCRYRSDYGQGINWKPA